MNPWENIQYQTIKKVKLKATSADVEFGNGDTAQIELNVLLPFTKEEDLHLLTNDSIQCNAYEIHFIFNNGQKISVPWDKIRVLSDKNFSRFMAEKAEEQAKLIGMKLRRLREKKGIRSNDLADRSGLTAQTISRIEKGHTDVGFSTLRKLLASMGYTLRDLAAQELELEAEKTPEKSYDFLIKKLTRAGIDSNLLTKRIIPTNVQASIVGAQKNQPSLLLDEAASYVSTVFNWPLQDVWSNKELAVESNAATKALYKMPANANLNQLKAYSHYAFYLTQLVLKASTKSVLRDFPDDAADFKKTLLREYDGIDLESIVRYAWDIGIIVLPLSDSGLFHGAAWNINDKHAIVVKQNTKSHARWVFDLLHELYHILDHLQEPNTSLIEESEISPFSENLQEREANSFANLVLFDSKAEDYAQECVEKANWNLAKLSESVKSIASKNKIREDSLANYLAFRLSFQKQNWWPQATKLQITNPDPYSIVIEVLKEKISLNNLNPIENNILKMAMNT